MHVGYWMNPHTNVRIVRQRSSALSGGRIIGRHSIQGLGRCATRAPWLTSFALTGEE